MGMAGGKTFPNKEFVVTTTQEMTLKEFLAAYPISLKYRSEMCWVRFYNSNAPVASGGTYGWAIFHIDNLQRLGMSSANTNANNVSPNDLGTSGIGSGSGSNYTYFNIDEQNRITNSTGTNNVRHIPTGTEVYVLHIPFSYSDFSMTTTEL